MKKHTMKEWADFLGVALVKNNFRTTAEPPAIFHRNEVKAFLREPQIVPQRYGKPCYVDLSTKGKNGVREGAVQLDIDSVIGPELWQLISDLENVLPFDLVEPDFYGDAFPVVPISGSSYKQMEIADSLKPAHGKRQYTRCDPIDVLETRNPETNIEQIENKYKGDANND